MAWNSPVHIFGPGRKPLGPGTSTAPVPPPLWRAEVSILERGSARSPAWRHLFLEHLESGPWTPPGHPNLKTHLPGTSIIRCLVTKLVVRFPGSSDEEEIAFTPRNGVRCESTLIVQTIPRDEQGPNRWDIRAPGNAHYIHSVPLQLCVAGEILTKDLRTTREWRGVLSSWAVDWNAIPSDSLVAHSSGLSFRGIPQLAWTETPPPAARYNMLIPRPVQNAPTDALLIELDRQWLLSDQADAVAALSDYRRKFGALDSLLRQASIEGKTHWIHLQLQDPQGPPEFHWLIRQNGASAEFRLRRGAALVSISDQSPGVRDVVPRSIATLVGEIALTGQNNAFQVRLRESRELSVDVTPFDTLPDHDLAEFAGRLVSEHGRLRWLPGRSMTRSEADQLTRKFPNAPSVHDLISEASVSVDIPGGVTLDLTPFPRLEQRVRNAGGRLTWFGVALHEADPRLAQFDPAVTELDAAIAAAASGPWDVLSKLRRQLLAAVEWRLESSGDERVEWSAIDTVYDANETAEFLRGVHGVRRPDPDEVSAGGDPGQYLVQPAMLWGSVPLDNGWAALPFFNVTDELYLRLLQLEPQRDEAALLGGAAIWGNDDPRLWSTYGSEQRWNLTLLDADQILGYWSFRRDSGSDPYTLRDARVRLYQPEVVFNGFLWLSTRGPTPEDALPDLEDWSAALRAVSLRSPRAQESYPSPYLVTFPEGRITRRTIDAITAGTPPTLNASAHLDRWQFEIEANPRQVRTRVVRPAFVETCLFEIPESYPNVPEQTDRLRLIRQMNWPANTLISQQALDKLADWAARQDGMAWSFQAAVDRLRRRMVAVGANSASPEDLVETFEYSDGYLIGESASGWGALYRRLRLETLICWDGGDRDPESESLLQRWRDHGSSSAAFRAATQRVLDRLAVVPPRQEIFELLRTSAFWSHELEPGFPTPLVWQRHPSLPFVQSLPLTQSLSPPSHPSSSRELAPFDLDFDRSPIRPRDWAFGSAQNAGNSAESWGVYRGSTRLDPASDWTGTPNSKTLLRLASLSLPGVAAHPDQRGPVAPVEDQSFLPLQWSFGIPFLDEVYALAQLPREEGLAASPAGMSSSQSGHPAVELVGDQGGSPPPAPLLREMYEAAWKELCTRALLASADEDQGLHDIGSNQQEIRSLVEPLAWRVNATLADAHFPGSLQIQETGTAAHIVLKEPLGNGYAPDSALAPRNQTALRGIQGTFAGDNAGRLHVADYIEGDATQFDIVAGSMQARSEGDRIRDQRGLRRAPTTATGEWLKTPIDQVTLWTSLAAVDLDLGQFGAWQLWFSGLPVEGGVFQRPRSTANEDVNDPNAEGRSQNHLQGYEWRLADARGETGLAIGPLAWFPLTLQRAEFTNDNLTRVELTGRLQLPLPSPPDEPGARLERSQDANVIRLIFVMQGGRLQWQSGPLAERASPLSVCLGGTPPQTELIWPLHPEGGAPQLRLENIEYDQPSGRLNLRRARVDLAVLGAAWSPALPSDAYIDSTTSTSEWSLVFTPEPEEVRIDKVTLQLDLDTPAHGHQLRVVFKARWRSAADAPHLSAEKILILLPAPDALVSGLFEVDQALAFRLRGVDDSDPSLDLPEDTRQLLHTPAIQLGWREMVRDRDDADEYAFYVLPGFGVRRTRLMDGTARSHAPGYASVSFDVRAGATRNDTPALINVAGAAELLLQCDWGKSLQEHDVPGDDDWARTERAFCSSGGTVSVGLLTSISGAGTSTSLILNGLLEVKSLVSWPPPGDNDCDPASATYTLPSDGGDLNHWRHTARILLNQLTIGHDRLTIPQAGLSSAAGRTLFGVRGVFPFLSVVEHQVAELEVTRATGNVPPRVGRVVREFRWAVSQEVRLASPGALKTFWQSFSRSGTAALQTVDTARDNRGFFRPVRQVLTGWLREQLLVQMAAALDQLGQEAMLVELSVALQIPRTARTSLGREEFVNIQVLPGEIDQAVPTDLVDYVPPLATGAAGTSPWGLVVLPFVGRLQPAEHDGLSAPNQPVEFSPSSPLRVDPVLWLTQPANQRPPWIADFTSRRGTAQEMRLAQFDSNLIEQVWGSIDPASLETGWYRLLTPPPERENAPTTTDQPLSSILAALPQGSLGRISRGAALEQLFDPDLETYPPSSQVRPAGHREERIEWRYGGLLALHSHIQSGPADQGFFVVGKRLAQLLGRGFNRSGRVRLAALTLIPPKLRPESPNPGFSVRLGQPVSCLPSPYLALRRLPLPDPAPDDDRVAIFADLVVRQARSGSEGAPIILASRLWQSRFREENGAATKIPLPETTEIREWAEETRRGLAGDSLSAVLRIRRVLQNSTTQLPALEFEFVVLPPAFAIPLPPPPGRALRPELGLLHAREGQFGGTALPLDRAPVLLAPPQTTSVEPLHLEIPPRVDRTTSKETLRWHGGYSGLRLSQLHTQDQTGQVSAPIVPGNGTTALDAKLSATNPIRISWMATSQPVQFNTRLVGATFLPRNFRSDSIRSLLPAPPGVPGPAAGIVGELLRSPDQAGAEPWQAELPGSFQTLLIGGRAGAYTAMRTHLQSQLESPVICFRFHGAWDPADRVIIRRGGVELPVVAGSNQIREVVRQVVLALRSTQQSEFADLLARQNGSDLILRSSLDRSGGFLSISTLEGDGSPSDRRSIHLEAGLISGPSTCLAGYRFEGSWLAGDRITVQFLADTLAIDAPSSDIVEIVDHVARAIERQFGASGALRAAGGADRLRVWFLRPAVTVVSRNSDGSPGDPERIESLIVPPATSVTTSGSLPVQHRWPRPVHIPANGLASRERRGVETVYLSFSGTWEADDKILLESGAHALSVAAGSTDTVQIARDFAAAVTNWAGPGLAARSLGNVVLLTRSVAAAVLDVEFRTTEADDGPPDGQVVEMLGRTLPAAVTNRAQIEALTPWGSWFDLQQEFDRIIGSGAAAGGRVEVRLAQRASEFLFTTSADAHGRWECPVDWNSLPDGSFDVRAQSDGNPLTEFSPRRVDNGRTSISGTAPAGTVVTVVFSNGRGTHEEVVTADSAQRWSTTFDWNRLTGGLIHVSAAGATGFAPQFHRGLNEVAGYGETPGSTVTVTFAGDTGSFQETAEVSGGGDWSLPIKWDRLSPGVVNVVVTDQNNAQLDQFAPKRLENCLNRSVSARRSPHDSLFLMDGDLPYELDVELEPLAPSEPGVLTDRWATTRPVNLKLTARPAGSESVWQDLQAASLRLLLCSETARASFHLNDAIRLPRRQFLPDDAPALQQMIDAAAHGAELWFELHVSPRRFPGKVEGGPLVAKLPVQRVRSGELPIPLSTMFCRFEDPEYSRRLSSPTARVLKSIRARDPNVQESYPITLALDRQEYNPSSLFYLVIGVPPRAPTSPGDAPAPGIDPQFQLTIRRIDPGGGREVVAVLPHPLPLLQLIDLRFGETRAPVNRSYSVPTRLQPGDRLEFVLESVPGTLLDPTTSIVLSVQIVRDPVAPPPEAGYGLLRADSARADAAVHCVRFAWSPVAGRMELIDPTDLLRDSVRRRAVFSWRDVVRPRSPVSYGIQKLCSGGSTLVPPPFPTDELR